MHVCEHVLLIDDHPCYPHYPMIVTLNILVYGIIELVDSISRDGTDTPYM